METTLIFVYGTLRGHTQLGDPIEQDRVPGVIYDLVAFPGYRPGEGWVVGEVRRIPTPMLESLDLYEGVDRGFYSRRLIETERGHKAWIYQIHPKLIEGAQIITSGDWLNSE